MVDADSESGGVVSLCPIALMPKTVFRQAGNRTSLPLLPAAATQAMPATRASNIFFCDVVRWR